MSHDILIAPWTAADRAGVVDLILGIQQHEFGLPITIDDQPDLVDVDGAYRAGGGEFFVARAEGRVAGTVAARVVEDNTVALRKMFVHPDERGATGLAAMLMDTIVTWTRRAGYRTILLGTTERMAAAHRFYEKHGFTRMAAEDLPSEFPRMAVDSVFFRRDLPGVVHIRPYTSRWPRQFEQQRHRLTTALEPLAAGIEHVGSTSVPGLPAKPIIDIVLTVPDSADEPTYAPQLTAVGYSFTIREADWFEHRLFNRDWPRVNLHIFSTGCDEVTRMVAFRNHLRCNTADREMYAEVKLDLARREWDIVQDYADAKTDVVAEIMGRVG